MSDKLKLQMGKFKVTVDSVTEGAAYAKSFDSAVVAEILPGLEMMGITKSIVETVFDELTRRGWKAAR